MVRELVLDTETTGLNYEIGHRLVEIGIVELDNHVPTGNYFHYYLNPERESDEAALKVHGLNKEFLSNKPKFDEIVEEFLEFISDSKIIIHNASFDVGFINAELKRCNISELNNDCIIDTLQMAKKKFLGQSVSLDSLCRKFNIDLSERNTHGALKDARLLASVYLELIGGRQSRLEFDVKETIEDYSKENTSYNIDEYNLNLIKRERKLIKINQEDLNLHLRSINEIKNSIWKKLNI
jgi:DNA polymerase-3 subunit epsilon